MNPPDTPTSDDTLSPDETTMPTVTATPATSELAAPSERASTDLDDSDHKLDDAGSASRNGLRRFEDELMVGGAVEPDAQPASGAQAVLGLLAIVGLFVWLWTIDVWYAVFAVAVLFAIFLHELGHYATARWSGMKVTQFFIGFGPRIWSVQRGETEYGIRALPLGAFVRIIGMNRYDEVPPSDESRTYRVKSFPRRLLVISAGSLMHMALAITVLFGVYVADGRPITAPGAAIGDSADAVSGAALEAGVEPGDVVLSVGEITIDDAADLPEAVRRFEPGDATSLRVVRGASTVERGGTELDLPITLGESFPADANIISLNAIEVADGDVAAAASRFADGSVVRVAYRDRSEGGGEDALRYVSGVVVNDGGAVAIEPVAAVGIRSGTNGYVEQPSVPAAAVHAVGDIFPISGQMIKGVVGVFNPANIWGHVAGTNIDLETRPITIVGAGQESARVGSALGLGGFLMLFALLNIFIGLFNMFPLLPLDGGHAAIAVYERIREIFRRGHSRYYADVSKLMPLTVAVVMALVLFFVSGLYLDITRPL